MVAGGLESISLVQNEHKNRTACTIDGSTQHKPEIYMPMIDTAEIVAKRYDISREAQDEYALQSQQRTAAAQAGRPLRRRDRAAHDRRSSCSRQGDAARSASKAVTLDQDEGNRADTTLAGLAQLEAGAGRQGAVITAGNASQLSDGASACVVMDGKLAEQRGLQPLGIFRGLASPAASRTRWASARSSRCRGCSSATA